MTTTFVDYQDDRLRCDKQADIPSNMINQSFRKISFKMQFLFDEEEEEDLYRCFSNIDRKLFDEITPR